MRRLPETPTQRINLTKKLSFSYRGKTLEGAAGDTVASALYASGVRIFSRSLKYHRPRGLYSLDGQCSNCLMEIDGLPNMRAETTVLRDGMTVAPQNVILSPEFDPMGFLDKLDWAMPAGFYYRMFHKPYRFWPFFQNRIRKMAGIGKISPDWQGGGYDELYLNAEVCVIGGGPAGMRAATAAAGQGLRVVLLEARPRLGGFYDWRSAQYPPAEKLYERADGMAKELAGYPNLRVFTRTGAIGFYSDNLITGCQSGGENDPFEERYLQIRAESVVVAGGCVERPLIFNNNERPGVMQVGCAHRLAKTYGVLPGERAVFSVGDDLGLEAAADLSDLGLDVLCVADNRCDGQDPKLVQALRDRNIPFVPGWVASTAHGGRVVEGATLSSTDGVRQKKFSCDLLVASAGLTPAAGPLFLAHARMSFDLHTGFFLPAGLPPKVHAAGRLLGYQDPGSIEASGYAAGLSAAADCGAQVDHFVREASERLRSLPGPANGSKLVMAPGRGRKRFVCFDEDTTVKNIDQSCAYGFDIPELAKRFTAAGTGPGQGGIPGHNLPLVLAQYHGESPESALPTTVRPPLTPTLLATYAGSRHNVFKRTPLHDSQMRAGGIMRRAGVWKRARYFSQDFTCREEIENVRQNVGMIDVSTLGKFRVFGPDALKALQRVYVGDMSRIPEGKLKYSAMCNEDGCLLDDGVVARLGDNDYYFTTSTNRTGGTAAWFRYHSRYEDWDFNLVNLSDAWSAINVAGPKSRAVLQKLTDADLSNEAFPYMGFRQVLLNGTVPARLLRVGFVGELSFEAHVPSSCAQSVWDRLMEAGAEFRIRPFGLEAQNVLRLEKGHVIIGVESEIRTTLHDLGMGCLWCRHKPEAKTVGAPALRFTEHQEGRLKLVGFKMENPRQTPKDGSLVVDDVIRGHVCTARYSFALKESIGLAMVEDGLAQEGQRLAIFEDGAGETRLYATVVPTPFYDPGANRLKM
ncbi:MAG: 2Fe-2S iron-sulfur cluster-binding protein [Desulfobacteraceae bacterium]|nr:2Fe-2S iron-sulfur cluster-binding protein [Desulfobacteraceae bacterium]